MFIDLVVVWLFVTLVTVLMLLWPLKMVKSSHLSLRRRLMSDDTDNRGNFGVSNIFVKPDLRLKSTSV